MCTEHKGLSATVGANIQAPSTVPQVQAHSEATRKVATGVQKKILGLPFGFSIVRTK